MLENDLHKIAIDKCLCFFGEWGAGARVCVRGRGGGGKKRPTFHNSLADKNNRL